MNRRCQAAFEGETERTRARTVIMLLQHGVKALTDQPQTFLRADLRDGRIDTHTQLHPLLSRPARLLSRPACTLCNPYMVAALARRRGIVVIVRVCIVEPIDLDTWRQGASGRSAC